MILEQNWLEHVSSPKSCNFGNDVYFVAGLSPLLCTRETSSQHTARASCILHVTLFLVMSASHQWSHPSCLRNTRLNVSLHWRGLLEVNYWDNFGLNWHQTTKAIKKLSVCQSRFCTVFLACLVRQRTCEMKESNGRCTCSLFCNLTPGTIEAFGIGNQQIHITFYGLHLPVVAVLKTCADDAQWHWQVYYVVVEQWMPCRTNNRVASTLTGNCIAIQAVLRKLYQIECLEVISGLQHAQSRDGDLRAMFSIPIGNYITAWSLVHLLA